MGIVNVTPDSFSDGGRFLDPAMAVDHALRLEAEGADILDVGGESTRPGAAPVAEAEELRRVMPVLERLRDRTRALISIDTYKPGVARAALAAGASIVNHVAAAQADVSMTELVAERHAGYVCMHMRGVPRTMQLQPEYSDVVRDVGEFFGRQLAWLSSSGVAAEQVVLDVGIGFGKSLEHNLALLAHLESHRRMERPLLLGVSRKSFLGKLLGADVADRLAGSLACACWAVRAGVQILRVHDVAATHQAVRLTEALMAQGAGEGPSAWMG